MSNQRTLQIAFFSFVICGNEIKDVGVFEHIVSQVRVESRQCGLKVSECFTFSMIVLCFNLYRQDVMTPAMLGGFLHIPESLIRFFNLIKQKRVMRPRYLCRHCLHKLLIRICFSKCPHVIEVTYRETPHVRELSMQVL